MPTNKRVVERNIWHIHTMEYYAAVNAKEETVYTTLQGLPDPSMKEKYVYSMPLFIYEGGGYKYISPLFFFLRKHNVVYFLKGYLTEEGENRVEGIEIKLHIFELIPFLQM